MKLTSLPPIRLLTLVLGGFSFFLEGRKPWPGFQHDGVRTLEGAGLGSAGKFRRMMMMLV